VVGAIVRACIPTHRWALLLPLVGAFVYFQDPAPAKGPVSKATPSGLRGNAGCAAASCHGGSGPRGSTGCEYSTWMKEDRHFRAYDALFQERSRVMEANYRRVKPADAQPQHDLLCLRCHTTDADAALRGQEAAFADGVGCERCHGPANGWLTEHYGRDWRSRTEEEKKATGYVPLHDLTAQAGLCVECHVGKPGQEVDHDLIAAGHPRLRFEYASFLATMPPHWDVAKEKARQPDLEARAWQIGQTVSARAALKLLMNHAEQAEGKKGPWPEFAQHDCFACHHANRSGGTSSGRVGLNPWYFALLPEIGEGAEARLLLDRLSADMRAPLPDPGKVRDSARSLGELLDRRDDSDDWARKLARLAERGADRLPTSWDEATQRYLALAALWNATTDIEPGRRSAKVRADLADMAANLRFPRGMDSPEDWDSREYQRRCANLRQHLPK
jgi:hypothetical protein